MPAATPHLPGKLGDPTRTIATDPRLDPRLAAGVAGVTTALEDPPVGPDSTYTEVLAHVATVEAEIDAAYAEMFRGLPPVRSVARRTEVIKGTDGNQIELFVHEPAERSRTLPGIVHLHGGGMVMLAARDPQFVRWRDELAATGLCVVGVEFRNGAGKLGNHPFPAGLNDCASATRWTHDNRSALGIDRIVLSGESGGSNLCLATALKALREGWSERITAIYACCPFVSGTYSPAPPELTSMHENQNYMLDLVMTQALVRAYDPEGEHATNPLAWPYHANPDDLKGLPPHVISVNELDPLRDEGLVYARKLLAAGVPTVSRTVNGTYHAADLRCLAAAPEIYRATLRDVHGFAASL